MMKKFQLGGIAALTLLGSFATSQAQAAPTEPVGYVPIDRKGSSINLVGITLHEPTVAAGAFETVAGVQLTDNDVDFSSILEDGTTYVLEINTGDAAGYIQEITTNEVSSNTISTPDDLSNLGDSKGIAAGAVYKIRKASTIASIFGSDNSAGLQEGTSLSNADAIWVQNDNGTYSQYFYHSGQTLPFPISEGWKTSTFSDATNLPLIYTDGLLIETKDPTDKTLTITGSVISASKKLVVSNGINLLGMTFPVGTTLASSNLSSQLQGGTSLIDADVIWTSNGQGGYNQYFYHVGQTVPFPISEGWKTSTFSDASNIEIQGAIFVTRHGDETEITSTPSF
jgi:hypothetical protein